VTITFESLERALKAIRSANDLGFDTQLSQFHTFVPNVYTVYFIKRENNYEIH